MNEATSSPFWLHWRWKFQVRGYFVRVESGSVITPCEAIVKSGIRAEVSPFQLYGVGPIAHANHSGAFSSWFVATGAESQAIAPLTVSVFVKVARGQWLAHAPPVVRSQIISPSEMLLDLGRVKIEQNQAIYVTP